MIGRIHGGARNQDAGGYLGPPILIAAEMMMTNW